MVDVRFAYADPPYPGQAKRWYGKHPDFAGEVDHAALIARLVDEYPDGWALSTSANALQDILALCPPKVRVCAWVKRMCAIFPTVSVQYGWEPVLVMGGRDRQGRIPSVFDWCSASPEGYTWRERPKDHVIGAKPRTFCFWVFDVLGALPGDEIDDLFPGSGAVSRAWDSYCRQLRLPLEMGA